MGLLDFLLSAGKAAADYAQKHPQDVVNTYTSIRKTRDSNKATTCIDKYYLRHYIKNQLSDASYFKVIDKSDDYMTIEVYNCNNQLIKRTRCLGDSVDSSYQIGQSYTF